MRYHSTNHIQGVTVLLQTPKLSYLTDLSRKDRIWDKRKAQADRYSALYIDTLYHEYSKRIGDCSNRLVFKIGLQDNNKKRLKLKTARFCRVARCPICQGRRALKWTAKTKQITPKILEDYPKSRYIMLSFTVENCELKDLRSQLSKMNKAWAKMVQRKEWKVQGWIRTTEVTRADDDKAHPHFHALLMVPSSYFGSNYITQERWRELWKESLKVGYLPQVNVQAVKPRKGVLEGSKIDSVVSATVEVIKYAVKPSDVLKENCDQQIPGQRVRMSNQDWLVELTNQLYKARLLSCGGVLKEYFKDLEDERQHEKEDLTHLNETVLAEPYQDEALIPFDWKPEVKRYAT